jgi:predicted Co/Zn/Cd cation transporter (cation efflux family)
MKKQLLILTLLLVAFISCKSVKETVKTTENIEVKKEHFISYKDTILIAPAISSSLSIPLQLLLFKDSLNPVLNQVPKVFKQQNGRSKVSVTSKNGIVTVKSECDSIAIRAQIRKELIKDYTNKTHETAQTKVVKSGYNLLQVMLYSFAAFSIGAVATFILKTTKII